MLDLKKNVKTLPRCPGYSDAYVYAMLVGLPGNFDGYVCYVCYVCQEKADAKKEWVAITNLH